MVVLASRPMTCCHVSPFGHVQAQPRRGPSPGHCGTRTRRTGGRGTDLRRTPTGRAQTRREVQTDLAVARANNEFDNGERGYVWETHAHRDMASLLAAKTNDNVR